MRRPLILAVVFLALLGLVTWLQAEPAPRAAASPPDDAEHAATIAALRNEALTRPPVIAVLAVNAGTETTDFVVPYAVLKRAGIAEVVTVATGAGPVTLMPALTILADTTTAAFDASHPDGADYVVVPALHDPEDAQAVAWLRAQAAHGARIIAICSGARVAAAAGLLDGHAFAGHWYDVDKLAAAHPTARHVADRRYVADRNLVTTTGVSASLPVALALVEAIGGPERARALAGELGVRAWSARHDSRPFALDTGFAATAAWNVLRAWPKDEIAFKVTDGTDEIALALASDAWGRTWLVRVTTVGDGIARGAAGLRIVADGGATTAPVLAAASLDTSLRDIASRYGPATARFVSTQMEYGPEDR